MTTSVQRPGLATGSLIGILFGLVFVEVNAGGLTAPWSLVVRIAGAVIAVALFLAVRRLPRGAEDGGFAPGRRYWIVVVLEAIALFGGLFVINGVLRHPQVAVAWIAVVVGVHFFALAAVFRLNRFHALGAVLTVLGVAGFVLAVLGAPAAAVNVVSGVLSGFALFATVALSVRR
ncbi:hypothetical protein FNH05_37685 [Amycolatopsis rhizosphaerae]|uniref:Uncharacterized protein n=1 Tax=Amycolatopsis rhizosphaerae TaxID=2053003 RepID=A0A557ZN15_9PSEU|nr:hypothetical protein [Amycolatopsis rhizosphaerae]TVT13371.1 hypothetical protein FNH05_37685 [Amycolatopsis rhizosphaerae]